MLLLPSCVVLVEVAEVVIDFNDAAGPVSRPLRRAVRRPGLPLDMGDDPRAASGDRSPH